MAKDFKKWIESAKANHVTVVNILIDSPGGSVDDGYTIIHTLEDSKDIVSSCKVDTSAMSMAFGILQSCTERSMTKRATLMAHEIKVQIKGTMSQTSFENEAAQLKVSNRAMAEHNIKRMKISLQKYQAHTVGGKDWHMDWEEAVRIGAVDSIVKF
jgi:ATP-dependent protease ClpP protease subunit